MLGWILYYALPNFSDVVIYVVAKTILNRVW